MEAKMINKGNINKRVSLIVKIMIKTQRLLS